MNVQIIFFSEGGFISSGVPGSTNNGTGLTANGGSLPNYVDDDMCSSLYDIPAYDTESSLVCNNIKQSQF